MPFLYCTFFGILSVISLNIFENLLQIAVPCEFLFCGDIPEQMKQAAVGMGLHATFAPKVFGFDRV